VAARNQLDRVRDDLTPSLIEIVLNSIGVPPAARMPSFTASASRRWL